MISYIKGLLGSSQSPLQSEQILSKKGDDYYKKITSEIETRARPPLAFARDPSSSSTAQTILASV